MRTTKRLAVTILAAALLGGCGVSTNVAVTNPASAEKTVKVTVSGRSPESSRESVRELACKIARTELRVLCDPNKSLNLAEIN